MKNALSFVLFLFVTFAFAQTNYGIKTGLHFSQVHETFDGRVLSTNAFEGNQNQVFLRPQLGFWMSTSLSTRLALQSELLFTQKVWNYLSFPAGGQELTFNYLSVPLALAYRVGRFQLTVGPGFTYLLGSYYREASPLDPSTRKSEYVDANELGLAANVGVQYEVDRWLVGLRATRDLSAIPSKFFTDVNGEPVLGFEHYFQGATLWAGYALSR